MYYRTHTLQVPLYQSKLMDFTKYIAVEVEVASMTSKLGECNTLAYSLVIVKGIEVISIGLLEGANSASARVDIDGVHVCCSLVPANVTFSVYVPIRQTLCVSV